MKTYPLEELTAATLAEVADIRREPSRPEVWDELARKAISQADRAALKLVTDKLFYFNTHRANEATVWGRAIYPVLVLAERGGIIAFSVVPLRGDFDGVELRGEADGAL